MAIGSAGTTTGASSNMNITSHVANVFLVNSKHEQLKNVNSPIDNSMLHSVLNDTSQSTSPKRVDKGQQLEGQMMAQQQ